MKKRSHFLIILLMTVAIIPYMLFGMLEPEKIISQPKIILQPKFDSTKDYHHFYPNSGFMKSLRVICLGAIANNVKNNIDTKDPLASKQVIEGMFEQLEHLKISPNCLLQYWKAHTQPTWKYRADVPGHVNVQWYNAKLCMWYDDSFDAIGILDGRILTYRNNPCQGKIKYITSMQDNSCIAVASDDELFIILNQHSFPSIAGRNVNAARRVDAAWARSLAFSADNTVLFVGYADGLIEGVTIEYDNPFAKKGNWKKFLLQGVEKDPITHLSCAPNGSYFVSVNSKGEVYKWDQHTPDLQCADLFVPKKIAVEVPVSKSIISPDSKFIYFKKDEKEGFLFDVKQESLRKKYSEVVAITPGNKLIVIHNNALNNVSLDGKVIKSFHRRSDPTLYSQSLNNNHLVDSDFYTHKNDGVKITEFNTLAEPTFEQLLYKLSLEAARENGRKADLNFLKTHPLFATFLNLEQKILALRIEGYIETEKPETIAEAFVEKYIKPLIYANEPFDSIINDDFLSGYDVPTLEKIHDLIKENLADWFVDQVSNCKDLDVQVSRFNDEATKYLITVDNSFPVDTFNHMLSKNVRNLVALKKIQKTDIEHRLRISESNQDKILSVETTIVALKQRINKDLCSNRPRKLVSLIDGEAEGMYGEKKVTKFKQRVKQRIREIVGEKGVLAEIHSSVDLIKLFSQEEIEQLDQIPVLEDNKNIIDSFDHPQQGIDFITRLPRMQLAKSTKEELNNRAIEQTTSLYIDSLRAIVDSCKAHKKPITHEVLRDGSDQIVCLRKLAEANRDILSPKITKPAIDEAQTILGVLSTKMRIRKGIFFDDGSPSRYQVKIEKKLATEKMNNLINSLSAQRVHPHNLSAEGLSGLSVFEKK